MNVFHQFWEGLISFKKSVKFIFDHKITSAFAIPLVVNLVLCAALFYLFSSIGASVYDLLFSWLEVEEQNAVVSFILKSTIFISLLFLWLFLYQYISLVVLAPFLSIIAEKTLNILYGQTQTSGLRDFLPQIWRGLRVTLRLILLQLVAIALIYIILNVLVVTSPLIPLALFLVNAYFLGYAFIDYVSEYLQYSFHESVSMSKGRTGLLLGIGTGYQFLMFIPILGVLFAPSITVVAACLGYFSQEKK